MKPSTALPFAMNPGAIAPHTAKPQTTGAQGSTSAGAEALPDLFAAPAVTPAIAAAARAAVVNRTHRVVRERAEQMQQRQKSRRELVLPLVICSAVLLLVCYAAWVVVSGTGFGAVGSEIEEQAGKLLTGQTVDTGSPMFLLLLWFLPITVVTVSTIYLRRGRRNGVDTGRGDLRGPLHGNFPDEVSR